ncbi:MAG: VWA domain-containing protein [Methyloprofundus sp.]|nr:VWA domain-containing protein [Methyloprofundus sp.]
MTFSEFHFIRPYWLLAFLPLLVFIFLNFKNKLQQGSWQAVCDSELLPFILQEKEAKQSRLPLVSSILAAVLSITALAGPTWQRIPTPVFRNAAALVIALDLSRSMDATDIKPSRLERARYKISDLLKKRKDGQTALLVYANSAFTVTPLTGDTETINSQLAALSSDIMPAQGSNSALAIQHAVQLFKNAGLQKGQILLISDDESLTKVDLASAYQLSILAVGTAGGAPIKLAEGGFLKDSRGNIVIPKLNSRALQKVAQASGGIYQQVTANDKDIDRLSAHFEQTAKHSSVTGNDLLLENWVEAGVWLLLPVLLLSAFSFRRGLLSLLFIFLLPIPKNSYALEWQDLWQTKDQQAQQSYLKGDYKQAAEKFTDPAWQAAAHYKADTVVSEEEMNQPTTDKGFYNQGNVLAKSGQLEKAIESYQQALKLNADNKDAQYNKDLVEKELEKQKQQNQDKNKQQDKDKDQENKDQPEDQQGEQSEGNESQDQQGEPSESSSEQQEPENSEQQADSSEKEADQQTEQSKSEEASQPEKSENEQSADATQASKADTQNSEQQQENEQWLRSIPDDPSGLLKRKFKYQYGRQGQRQENQQQW